LNRKKPQPEGATRSRDGTTRPRYPTEACFLCFHDSLSVRDAEIENLRPAVHSADGRGDQETGAGLKKFAEAFSTVSQVAARIFGIKRVPVARSDPSRSNIYTIQLRP
jgi:hypothetical protein